MTELIRDTVFGHSLRLATRGRVLQYEEERDPTVLERYVDKEKSGRMAHHGHTGLEGQDNGANTGNSDGNNVHSSRRTSDTRVESSDERLNEASGVVVDPEKGRDVTIVTWFSENDPEVGLIPSLVKSFI